MADVEYTQDGHIARVRLNRPKSLNAITRAMDERLFEIWQAVNADPEIWVVVLSAEGERAFCAGADVSGDTGETKQRLAIGGGLTGICGPTYTLNKPLIATVQGHVLGAGFELAMCADIIVAADTAKFSLPETLGGIIGECGVMHRAIRQLPYRVALNMILTGERLSASQALQFGLINEVTTYGELSGAADRWCEKVLAASPLAVQAAKHAVLSRLGSKLEEALATRYEPIEAYANTEDVKEGRKAFGERRKPVWVGR